MMRLTLPLLALLCAPLAFAQSAKELNTEGFRLYQAGKYPEALEKFQAAVAKDPKHALAHYNVAATLGVLRKQGKVCHHDAYTSTILEHLATAIRLDPRRLKRAKEDADLDPIRETVGWHKLLGRSHTRTADVPELLKKVKWFGPGVGVYGTLQTLRFEEGGKLVLTKKVPQDEGPMKEERLSGTYTLKGRQVEVKLPGHKVDTGAITAQGVLQLKHLGAFYDFPSECDA
ncbi:MAG TPA: tetratricopeptide repeat protein [Myxococcaceae bacterium]|nr:tetratricopeptide repeat protein [Myxococcaceae bacterium]